MSLSDFQIKAPNIFSDSSKQMKTSKKEYSLLQGEDSSVHVEEDDRSAWQTARLQLKERRIITALLLALLISMAYSIALTLRLHKKHQDIGRSPFSGLGYDTPTVYRSQTDYWGENETLSNELWESIDTSPVGVALSDKFADDRGLPTAGRFPWDHSKGTYFIKAFHQIHCLKLMRKMVVDLKSGVESVITWEHYQHCLDALRQDIMCHADDTPMPGRLDRHLGDGQVVMCRDWNKLIAWTQAPDQNACYHSLSDYKTVKHGLERHAFCEPGSQYYDVSREYFERWGHVDPYVE